MGYRIFAKETARSRDPHLLTGGSSRPQVVPALSRLSLSSNREGFEYLLEDQSKYLNNVLLRAFENTKSCMSMAPAARLIEVAFPETRKNDPSVTESLDINRAFSFEFAERMHKAFAYEKDAFWLLFPDKSEAALGIKSWEKRAQTPPPFTVASLDTADAQLKNMVPVSFPKLIVSINPG